ncbi:NUDIX hydrolase [Chitinophaga sedimenti]|uniref:NUDIX hydrolase n=1 Tax=Chitinophaga sedimenti TaxID=2033606 RepID=UPI00200649CB|nr:NUDIX domain-containing protein [Chitinophaga sedimenti]MCK7554752.1 NUDIX hydrolase [Chitinophaga sedimenti]
MTSYGKQKRLLVAVDCIIFGFDGQELKVLLIKRGFEPERGKWSLMGGFVQPDESFEGAAERVLKQLTGLEDIYMEQLYAFSRPDRDPIERTASIAYSALLDINQYHRQQLRHEFHAEWFSLSQVPDLIFDHTEMIDMAKEKLRYKAAIHPILFELLPQKFTIPQLQLLYEGVYETDFDKRNFSRKILSLKLLVKQKDKDKESSKRGAFYYKLDKRRYNANFNSFLNFIAKPHNLK